MYKAEFDWKSSGYLTKRVIVCDEGRRGSGKNNGIPNIPSMLRLSLTAYIRISASNHLFCIYEVPKRSFDKRGTCTYEINIGKPWKTEGNHVCDKRPHRYCFLFIKDLWKNGIGTITMRTNLLNCCRLVSISKKVVFYVSMVVSKVIIGFGEGENFFKWFNGF